MVSNPTGRLLPFSPGLVVGRAPRGIVSNPTGRLLPFSHHHGRKSG